MEADDQGDYNSSPCTLYRRAKNGLVQFAKIEKSIWHKRVKIDVHQVVFIQHTKLMSLMPINSVCNACFFVNISYVYHLSQYDISMNAHRMYIN